MYICGLNVDAATIRANTTPDLILIMVGHRTNPDFAVNDSYYDLMTNAATRALVMAGLNDAQPDCVSCTYNPYCGVPPVHAHQAQGHIWGTMRNSTLCAVHKGIQDYLFEKLLEADPQTMETFRRWTTVRDRDHFLQPQG